MWRKVLGILLALVVVVVGALAIYVASRQNLRYPAPSVTLAASTDSSVIERGRYVVRTVANCALCHGDMAQRDALRSGADIPLSGGFYWDIPPGKFRVPNLTPDPETGTGRFTDAALAVALRHGIGHDGRPLLPFMEFQGLSDEDLVAVVSYLRTQPPVSNPVPRHEFSVLGKVLKATLFATPIAATEPPPVVSPRGATVENGKYLAEKVANCFACHTQRDPNNGQLIGPRFGGATDFTEVDDPTHSWNPPNLTPDPETGRTGQWTEDEFVTRFRAGNLIPMSPMPWAKLAGMSEDDIRAIYRYLKSLPPVKRDVGPPVVEVAAKK
jgi:mono/diheme cytochrome c family protein